MSLRKWKWHQGKRSLCFLDLPCHRARDEFHDTLRQWHRAGFARGTYKPESMKTRESLVRQPHQLSETCWTRLLCWAQGFTELLASPTSQARMRAACHWSHQILRAPGRLSTQPGVYCIVWGSCWKREEARTQVGSRLLQPPPLLHDGENQGALPAGSLSRLHRMWAPRSQRTAENSGKAVWCTHPCEIHTCETTSVVM